MRISRTRTSGKFPTFPYAGYVTMAIGGAIFGYGQKLGMEAEQKKQANQQLP